MVITITGTVQEGKSTVAKLVQDALKGEGFVVELHDEELAPEWYDPTLQAKRVKSLKADNLAIEIRTIQVVRIRRVQKRSSKVRREYL